MGDNGALYVKPELVPVYREKVGLPKSSMHLSKVAAKNVDASHLLIRPGKLFA